MKYPNAQAGVKKIFTAEILGLIAAFCTIMAGVFLYLVVAVATTTDSLGATAATAGGSAIFGVAAAVLAIIALIFRILGAKKASVDEPGFKTVFYLILAGLLISVISGIVSAFVNNDTVTNIFSVVSDIISLAVTVYIIQSIRNLAVKLGNTEMDTKGNNLFKVIIAIYMLIIISRIIVLITGANTAALVVAGIFSIVAGVLSIVQYILYLVYLNKAKKMLAA